MHIQLFCNNAEYLTLCRNQDVPERLNVLIGCIFNPINEARSLGLLNVLLSFGHDRSEIRFHLVKPFQGFLVARGKVIEYPKAHSINADDRLSSNGRFWRKIAGDRVHTLVECLKFVHAEKGDRGEEEKNKNRRYQ